MFRDWKKSWVWQGSARLLPCIFLLLPWASRAASPPAVNAYQFDIPATTLDDALARFSASSGISVGLTGNLPRMATRPVQGRYAAQDALQLLLAGSGLEALPVGNLAYRLRLRTVTAEPAISSNPTLPELSEVVVTGAKRDLNLRTVPLSMVVVDGAELASAGMPNGSRAATSQDAAMSSTNLGPGRDRQYIRGVADSPFMGASQATVSVHFDEARATYDGPDPDLQLFDVAQVEILKGPQGPLYGTGALGGVFRIVSRKPDLDRVQMQAGTQVTDIAGGGAGAGAHGMLNVPLITAALGLRAVAYASTEPGWIDNTGGRADANDTRIRGGRVALRGALPGEWVVDLQGVAQDATTSDSKYLNGASRSLRRSDVLPEPHDNDFRLGSLTATGLVAGQHVLLTASAISHEADGILDASQSAAVWNLPAPLRYADSRHYRLANQEVRLWSDANSHLGWLIGASYLSAHSNIAGTLLPADGSANLVLQQSQHAEETALFGEISVPLPAQLRTTLGLRAFRSAIENEGSGFAPEFQSVSNSATPSVALDWRSADQLQFVYLRYARAIRPGGLDPAASDGSRHFVADELSNVDLGARLQLAGGALSLQGALFATAWSHIQSDYLLSNGLSGTRNVGNGRNVGIEASTSWSTDNHWRFEAGGTVQHARLHQSTIQQPEDSRLPVVPDVRLRGSVSRSFQLSNWQALLRADVDHVGATRLSFEEALDRKTPAYATLGARFSLQRGGVDISLHASNLLDSRADTFAFGNPFSIRSSSQYTPLQPRSVTLGVAYGW